MSFWKVLVVIFILTGVGVAVISLYKSSVAGSMSKLGLVDSDFAASVAYENLGQEYKDIAENVQCGLVSRITSAARLLLSSDDKQGEMDFRLGNERIKCGTAMIASGQVETGTYEVLKGIGYFKTGYQYVYEHMGVDYRVCKYLPESEIQNTINQLLLATDGRVHELIYNEWGGVLQLQEQVGPTCLDQRQSVR